MTACAENIADSSGTMEKVPEKITLGLLQHACDPNPAQNLDYALNAAKNAAQAGAQIICTQELFASQYFCQSETHEHFDLAEPIPGPKTRAFQELARTEGVVIVASLFEKRAAGLYHNSAVIIDADGSLLGTYRKMHIPDDPQFYEKFYFTPGDLGFQSARTQHGHIGTLICWDQWYPEAARLTALQGAEVLFYPTAIGWLPPEKAQYGETQLQAWMGAMTVATNLTPWVLTMHMLVAILLIGIQIKLIGMAKGDQKRILVVKGLLFKGLIYLGIVVSGIQILAGTGVRQLIDEISIAIPDRMEWIASLGSDLYFHRSFAIAVLVINGLLFYFNVKRNLRLREISWLIGIVVVEALSGIGMAYLGVPAFLQPIHLTLSFIMIALQLNLVQKVKIRA